MPRDLAHLSDEAVVALAARSDEIALAELYDRYGRVAYGLALRVLRDEALAEDAVQEAFLAIWRGAARFIPERGKASTWILTLVHRRAVDLVRREQRRRTEPLPEGDEPAAPGGSADDATWLRLERERVQAALQQLPDQQREAIELAYYGGFTQSELAERLGQPLGTIKSRMFAGLAHLRELLEPGKEKHGQRHPPRADRRLRARRARARRRAGLRAAPRRLRALPGRAGRARRCRRSLAFAVLPAEPPPRLRARILEAARAERPNVVPLLPRVRLVNRPLVAIAAVAACAAVGLGVWNVVLHNDLEQRARSAAERAARGCRRARSSSARGGSGALVVSNLASAPAGKTYEAWVIENGKASPAGTFGGGRRTIVIRLTHALPAGAIVAVTVERAGGVEQPTRAPFITSQPV